VIDNFRHLYKYGFKGVGKISKRQDKGHREQFRRLIESISKGVGQLIPLSSLINTSLASFKALWRVSKLWKVCKLAPG